MVSMEYFDHTDSMDTNDSIDDIDNNMMKNMINDINTNGGKIYFSNGNINELSAGMNCVTLDESMIHIKAHGSYKEVYASVSSISCIVIY